MDRSRWRKPGFWIAVWLAPVLLAGCAESPQVGISASSTTPVNVASVRLEPSPGNGAPTDVGIIFGTVTDEELIPLDGATVDLRGLARVFTDASGGFRFESVPVGRQVVEAQASGHLGAVKAVEVAAHEPVAVSFHLRAVVVEEARIVLLQHTSLITAAVYGELSQYIPGACSDNCTWWFTMPELKPSHAVFEVTGGHSTPHPRGWDGLIVTVRGYANNQTTNFRILRVCEGHVTQNPNAACLRLPLRFPVNGSAFDNQDDARFIVTERIRIDYLCEETWFCLDDRYDTWVSFFYDYEGKEIPPDYSARPGG